MKVAPLPGFQWRNNGAGLSAPLLRCALGKKVMAQRRAISRFPTAHQWRNGAAKCERRSGSSGLPGPGQAAIVLRGSTGYLESKQ